MLKPAQEIAFCNIYILLESALLVVGVSLDLLWGRLKDIILLEVLQRLYFNRVKL